jgi:hypothetical protein
MANKYEMKIMYKEYREGKNPVTFGRVLTVPLFRKAPLIRTLKTF